MKVLLLLAFAAVGQCALLGSKKCTYGPSYWCSHLHHAKECNAMQHCMDTVWKTQSLDTMIGSSETCFDVIKVLDVIRHSTDADLMEQWAVGCTGLPVEKRQICKDLATHDMKEVYKLLKSDLTSRQVAGALNLCGGFEDTVPHPQQNGVSGDYCKDCVIFFGDLRDLFNTTEGQVEVMVKEVICTKMGPLESMCDQLVDNFGSVFFNYVMQQLDPEVVCKVLHLCANQSRADLMKELKEMMTKKQLGGIECDLCKTVFENVQRVLTDATFQNDVFAFLKAKVCSNFGSYASECNSYVDALGPQVFQILVSELDPETVCLAVHICSPSASHEMLNVEQKLRGPECGLCKTAVQDLEEKLKDPTVQKDVLTFVKDDVCSLLESFADQCKNYVDMYGPTVFQILIAELDPQDVCQALSLCSKQPQTNLMKYIMLKHLRSSGTCDVCKNVVEDVQAELKDPNVQSAILSFLKNDLCSRLGGFADQCNDYVDAYGSVLFKILAAELNPSDVCQFLHLCTNQTRHDVIKSILAKRGLDKMTVECGVCKSLAKGVQSLLRDSTLQTNVLNFLKNDVCTLLSSFASECQNYVSTYGPLAFEVLVAELDPQTICQTLGFCNATTSSKLTRVPLGSPLGTVQILPSPKKVNNFVTCDICQLFVKKVDEVLAEKGEAEAKKAMEDICKALPEKLSASCDELVKEYGDQIIDMLLKKLTPKFVCLKLDLCPSAARVQAVKLEVPVKGVKCDVCKEVIDFVKKEVNSSKARTFEKKMLDKICTDVPTKYGFVCTWFVNKYAPAIINMFEAKADPAQLCSVIDLCGVEASHRESHPLRFVPMQELQPARPHLLGRKECLYGPSFWCASDRNAKLCQAEEACKRMKERANKTHN